MVKVNLAYRICLPEELICHLRMSMGWTEVTTLHLLQMVKVAFRLLIYQILEPLTELVL